MPYLEQAVDSILNQSFEDIEFVIVNDGSTDSTGEFLDSISDSRVKVFHEANRGTAGASNFGLQHCTRKYVARMDADDVSLPSRLEQQYQFMETNPDVSLLGSQVKIIGNQKVGVAIDLPLDHKTIMRSLMQLNHGMSHGSCFYRNEIIQKIGGYWSAHRTFDDWDMFLRMGEEGKLANLPTSLYFYRTLSTSLVGSRLHKMRMYYAFAVECARRRQANEPEILVDAFIKDYKQRPWFQRATEAMGVYALNQYRRGTAEVCGDRPILGYARMGWSAICSPKRTANRLGRILSASQRKQTSFSDS